ncbi:MAG: capsule biosynthesis protein [Gemmobacter sp.]
MTTKPTARRFRIRRSGPLVDGAAETVEDAPSLTPRAVPDPAGAARSMAPDPMGGAVQRDDSSAEDAPQRGAPAAPVPAQPAAATIDAIRAEGLTGRQLRLARRVAQKHDLPATSDYDAVRLLRAAGIDPFQRANLLELVTAAGSGGEGAPPGGSRALATVPAAPNLPQTARPAALPSPEIRAEQNHAADILRIQADIMRRRRRRAVILAIRLAFFVLLPTLAALWYFAAVATPLYGTRSEFVIQQAESATGAGGLGSLFSGTQFATSQDSIAVQGYLQSREAMQRLDRDEGFRAAFSGPGTDPILRLPDDASSEAVYATYRRNVKIAYDPTEGIIKMEVSAPSPELSAAWSRALIRYAEEQVDTLTQRLRGDQMRGAMASYEQAEANLRVAQDRVVALQERYRVLSSEVEVSLLTAQITNLETQLTQDRLSLIQMQSNATPNRARMEPLERRIATLTDEIATLRARLTEGGAGGLSLARVQSELLVAQADVETRQLLLAQSLQQLETARIEANRQVRYLSVSVSPVAPDVASYPRVFENTAVVLLLFAGIYLMVSMTASILREQISA